jgi:hypothetical protein
MEGSNAWWSLKGEGETSFFHFPLQQFYLNLFFSIDLKVLFYHGSRPLLYTFFSFSLTYKLQPRILMYQIFHTFIVKLILIEDSFFPFVEFMVSHMITSYGLQVSQMNEEPRSESSLNLTLMQHPHDENPKP